MKLPHLKYLNPNNYIEEESKMTEPKAIVIGNSISIKSRMIKTDIDEQDKISTHDLSEDQKPVWYNVIQYKCPDCDKLLNIIDVEIRTIEFCPYCGMPRTDMEQPMHKGDVNISIPELPQY
jgi:DNA-directed RNA polymerase subunit RPC12/RpoP